MLGKEEGAACNASQWGGGGTQGPRWAGSRPRAVVPYQNCRGINRGCISRRPFPHPIHLFSFPLNTPTMTGDMSTDYYHIYILLPTAAAAIIIVIVQIIILHATAQARRERGGCMIYAIRPATRLKHEPHQSCMHASCRHPTEPKLLYVLKVAARPQMHRIVHIPCIPKPHVTE